MKELLKRQFKNITGFITFLIVVNYVIPSCSSKTDDNKHNQSLAGAVFSSSNEIDSINCKSISKSTDLYQILLFLNDTLFVKIIELNCPPNDSDCVSEICYKGTYQLKGAELSLNFDSQILALHIKKYLNKSGDSTFIDDTHIEYEKMDKNTSILDKFDCGNLIYFRQRGGIFREYFAPDKNTIDYYKKNMKKSRIWKFLFSSESGI